MEKLWLERGVPADKVETSGMPMDTEVFKKLNKLNDNNILKKIGFSDSADNKVVTVTIATGGAGVGSFPKIVKSLAKTFHKQKVKLQIIAVPAANKKAYKKLKQLQPQLPNSVRMKAFKGFIPKEDLMHYIKSSDLYITKAGGLSPTEAFFINKPLIILNLFGGHEKENAAFFSYLKVAKVIDKYNEIGDSAYSLLFSSKSKESLLAEQKKFTSQINRSKIINFLTSSKPEKTKTKIKTKFKKEKIYSSAKEALDNLNKDFPQK